MRNESQTKPRGSAASRPATTPAPRATAGFIAGTLLLAAAACVTLTLVLERVAGVHPPGCGPGSACASAARSAWGTIGKTDWPVSFVGFAYFDALLAAWVMCRGRPGWPFRTLVRLGALASAWFVYIIIREKLFCGYCLTTHLLNFLFWMLVEFAPRPAANTGNSKPVIGWAGVFAMTTVILAFVDAQVTQESRKRAEDSLTDSTRKLIEASTRKSTPADNDSISVTPTPPVDASTSQTTAAANVPAATDNPKPFAGRWRWGPEKAPIRIVLFTDFQCVDCNKIELEMRALLELHAQANDIAVWPKHFPMSARCNRHMKEEMHANACWAARAAEAAGMLYGNEGFWKMHHWLFDKKGGFTDAELREGVAALGFDAVQIERLMQLPETLAPVQADIEEAVSLGLFFTPMIFINGVELKGWNAPNAVTRAVEALAKTNPPVAGPEVDRPEPASAKFLADWREAFATTIPADQHPWGRGDAGARVQITMWGDYQEPNSAKTDIAIRDLIADRAAYYTFRHFPFDKTCNFQVPTTKHENACKMAHMVEAAGLLGGAETQFLMHDWMMRHGATFTEDAAFTFAISLGLDADALRAALANPDVVNAVAEDIDAGRRIGLQSLPWLLVNGKRVPRWQREGDNVLERILQEAGMK